MSNLKISTLSSATTPLSGSEIIPLNQSSVTDSVSVANLTAGRAVSALSLTLSNGNVTQGTSATGYNFTGNTPASGMTSQLLNWYEEGTWTPSDNSGAGLTFTITGTSKYTRIGRQVTAVADITYPTTSNTSLTYVTGFPFITGATPNGAGSVGYTDYSAWITIGTVSGASGFRFINSLGFATNLNLSGHRIQVCVTYFIS